MSNQWTIFKFRPTIFQFRPTSRQYLDFVQPAAIFKFRQTSSQYLDFVMQIHAKLTKFAENFIFKLISSTGQTKLVFVLWIDEISVFVLRVDTFLQFRLTGGRNLYFVHPVDDCALDM